MTAPVPRLTNVPRFTEPALCAETDPEAFFPEKGGSVQQARSVCRDCLARVECLAYALDNDERFGVWGGLSERERRKLRAKQPRPDRRPPCGTERGAAAHRRRSEKACEPCKVAERAARARRAAERAA